MISNYRIRAEIEFDQEDGTVGRITTVHYGKTKKDAAAGLSGTLFSLEGIIVKRTDEKL